MHKPVTRTLLGLLLSLSAATLVAAPAALVESVENSQPPLALFDFLEPGTVIDLGANGQLGLGYLSSCVQEEIRGGRVTIGERQSTVTNGQLSRTQLACDGQQLALAANESVSSGAMAFRAFGANDDKTPITVHSRTPVITLPGPGKVTIKRIDESGERHRLRIAGEPGKALKVDLLEQGITLTAGGRYMVSSQGRTAIFQVDAGASAGARPLLERIVPL